jgi:hypothetical protein
MRLPSILLAVFILPATLVPAWTQGQPFPYDPYPWCAVYGGRHGGGGSNCGFRTWQQCMATVSGIGGFCEPNQFYNPGGRSGGSRKKQPR